MFFSFDGLDGVGKSTQMKLFCDGLTAAAGQVLVCRDPGSTALGEAVRTLLLDRHDLAISRRAEMFLYMAARAQLVEQVIRPALDAGKTVVSDRFLLANVVYQGHAGGLDVEELWRIGRTATAGIEPDLTFILDMDPDDAARRLNRPRDRMELQGDAFRERVRAGFLAEAARNKERLVVIEAGRSIEEVHADIRHAAERVGVQIG
jgi:dTMP kinase